MEPSSGLMPKVLAHGLVFLVLVGSSPAQVTKPGVPSVARPADKEAELARIKERAKLTESNLRSSKRETVEKALAEWGAVARDFEKWAKKYHDMEFVRHILAANLDSNGFGECKQHMEIDGKACKLESAVVFENKLYCIYDCPEVLPSDPSPVP